MKPTRFFSTLTLLALPLAASAQPDPNNAPKGENPVNRPVAVGGRRGGVQDMTPEQIKTLMETVIKRQLAQANVTGDTQQTAVITYIMGEVMARQSLSSATRALQVGLRNPDSTDAQIATLLNDLQAAAEDEKTRHQKALDTLEAAVNVTQFPRLEAMLTVNGFYGDVPPANGGLVQIINGLGGNRPGLGGPPMGADAGGAAQDGNNFGGARGNMMNRRGNAAPF